MIYDWSHMINRALWLYTQRDKITYCLGCAGEVAGRDKKVQNQFKYYYDHGWKEKIGAQLYGWNSNMNANEAWNLWLSYNKDKMCFDCSGYLCWCMGLEGVHKYSSWSFAAMPENPSLSAGVAGSALWKTGHVGLDIGYGACLDIGAYNHSIELNMIGDKGWESSHLIKEVDYTGADAR